jgi:4,5-dihydroxyphthalate decarboxylase
VRGNHNLMDLLRTGLAAAAVFGNDLPPDPDLVPVFNRPQDADRAWYNHHRLVPINHVLAVRRDVAERHPQALRHLWEVLRAQRPLPTRGAIAAEMSPFGVSAMTRSVQVLLDLCVQQNLLPRPLSLEELFADAVALLGAAA